MHKETMQPLVSIVTVFYNRADYVADSIKTLLNQTYQNIEIIAVDDGSTDNTLDELKRIRDPRFTIISTDNNGFVKSLKMAIEESTGEYIAVHGSGDISHPQRIEKQVAVLQAEPTVGVVGCYVNQFGKMHTPPNGQSFLLTMMERQLFTHGEVMYRRNIYDRAGGYREVFTYAQDRDLWLRMAEHCDYRIIAEPLYTRKNPANSVTKDHIKMVLQAYLSNFAVACAKYKLQHGRCLLDDYGEHGIIFRQPTKELASRLSTIAARQYLDGNTTAFNHVRRLAFRECPYSKTFYLRTIAALDRAWLVPTFIPRIMAKRIR